MWVLFISFIFMVRVVSPPHDGASWTPLTVVFDPAEARSEVDNGARLVVSGRRLLVVGEGGAGYWALASDDAGASWHTP
jgi:hypothetical protein